MKSRHVVWVLVSVFLWAVGVYIEEIFELCAPATGPRRIALYVGIAILASWPIFFIEFIRNRIGVVGKLRQPLEALVQSSRTVPTQVESVFVESVDTEVRRMLSLAEEKPVKGVDLNTQYVYASGIAAHYRRHPVKSIGATALDPPSTFYQYHRRYFTMQEPLDVPSEAFFDFAKDEALNLELLIARIDAGGVGVSPKRHGEPPPNKARIVVIDEAKFRAELQERKFWEFVAWHVTYRFGLKFLLRDPADPYEDKLAGVIGLDKSRTIDDFIVYGSDSVFGRVNPEPDEGRVTLGFHYATEASRKNGSNTVGLYHEFFVKLWQDGVPSFPKTNTLTELWVEYPSLRQDIEACVSDLRVLKDLYEIRR